VRIVTYNIKHGSVGAGRIDGGLLSRTCKGFAADILALQEVDVRAVRSGFRHQAATVARATGMNWAFGEAARRGPIRRYGNALLARGTIGDREVVPLPQPANGEFRVAIVASVVLTGGPTVSVGATHLSFRKGEGAVQLDVLIEALGRRPAPRILLGDLNIGPALALPALEAAGYSVADTGPTFPASSPRTRIDFVAVSGLEIVSATVPEVPVSDHRPVVVEATDRRA
jgi:endonuclease/exonuclease/phosphatase family metal-dependent hydrolase